MNDVITPLTPVEEEAVKAWVRKQSREIAAARMSNANGALMLIIAMLFLAIAGEVLL
jgi:hypothetical protein